MKIISRLPVCCGVYFTPPFIDSQSFGVLITFIVLWRPLLAKRQSSLDFLCLFLQPESAFIFFTHLVVPSLTSGVCRPSWLRQRPSTATGWRRGGLRRPCGGVSCWTLGLGLRRPVGRPGCWGGVPAAGLRVTALLSPSLCLLRVLYVCVSQSNLLLRNMKWAQILAIQTYSFFIGWL